MQKQVSQHPLLQVQHLKKHFETPSGTLYAVDDVSFDIYEGKTLGVVGESGCGKSTMGRTILRLLEPTAGDVYYDGIHVNKQSKAQMKKLRRQMQIIFQDPFASLNPRMSVFQTIAESLLIQKLYSRKDKAALRSRVEKLMDLVGLSQRLINAYPHELDGGRRQRIGIARALALEPKFIVCDEPVSALDVSIQAQVLNLMQDLQEQLGLTYLFITHDLSVVKHFSDDIAVMYLGQLVEKTTSRELFKEPRHPYTKALLSAIPIPDPDYPMQRVLLEGELTSPIDPKPGCRFAKRCIYAKEKCFNETPPLIEEKENHFVACHYSENLE